MMAAIHWLEVDKKVGVVSALEGKRPAVDANVTLVQNHVSRRHGHVVRLAAVVIDLKRPRLIHILIDIDDGRRNQWQAVAVRGQDRAVVVHPDAVQRRRLQLLARPLLDDGLGAVPDPLLELPAGKGPLGIFRVIFQIDHVCGHLPVVYVDVSFRPFFVLLFLGRPLPVVLDLLPDVLRHPHLAEPHIREVILCLRLIDVHLDALVVDSSARAPVVSLVASLDEVSVAALKDGAAGSWAHPADLLILATAFVVRLGALFIVFILCKLVVNGPADVEGVVRRLLHPLLHPLRRRVAPLVHFFAAARGLLLGFFLL
mmetsp:Transcript_8471/g.31896  ORF Transcript_8471/g.31896 Transcript_8471/m.31896 type:complete len:314 (-) Transcript_8471:103-1044(-)